MNQKSGSLTSRSSQWSVSILFFFFWKMPNGHYLLFWNKLHVVANSIRTVMSNHTTEDELNLVVCHLIQIQILFCCFQDQQQTPKPTSWTQRRGEHLPGNKKKQQQHTTNTSPLSNKHVAVSTLSAEPKQKCLSLLLASKSPDTSACLLTSPATRRSEEVEVAEASEGGGKKSI